MAEKETIVKTTKTKTSYELFKEVQQTIKVGKSKYNAFAKFNYRSVEDIYTAWNALGTPLSLVISDEVIECGGRVFIQATATIKDSTGVIIETSKAQAELGTGKAGMSSEQATGSASSYARKYALNGLFLLDDSEDPDSTTVKKSKGSTPITPSDDRLRVKKIIKLQDMIRGNKEKTAKATAALAGRSLLKLTLEEVDEIIKAIA